MASGSAACGRRARRPCPRRGRRSCLSGRSRAWRGVDLDRQLIADDVERGAPARSAGQRPSGRGRRTGSRAGSGRGVGGLAEERRAGVPVAAANGGRWPKCGRSSGKAGRPLTGLKRISGRSADEAVAGSAPGWPGRRRAGRRQLPAVLGLAEVERRVGVGGVDAPSPRRWRPGRSCGTPWRRELRA